MAQLVERTLGKGEVCLLYTSCVCFPALVNGMQLTCAISGESLAYRFTGDTPEQWLASFRPVSYTHLSPHH